MPRTGTWCAEASVPQWWRQPQGRDTAPSTGCGQGPVLLRGVHKGDKHLGAGVSVCQAESSLVPCGAGSSSHRQGDKLCSEPRAAVARDFSPLSKSLCASLLVDWAESRPVGSGPLTQQPLPHPMNLTARGQAGELLHGLWPDGRPENPSRFWEIISQILC
jgi:hypothetical protein